MATRIHTSRKLEKLITKIIKTEQNEDSGILGKWNATVFYVSRKKCWLITNTLTKYNLILVDIKSSDLDHIEEIFKNTLYSQLVYDGIIMSFEQLDEIIGTVNFHSTDNDKSTTACQVQRLYDMEWWKDEYGSLENMQMKELNNRMNTYPIKFKREGKPYQYATGVEEMKKAMSQEF